MKTSFKNRVPRVGLGSFVDINIILFSFFMYSIFLISFIKIYTKVKTQKKEIREFVKQQILCTLQYTTVHYNTLQYTTTQSSAVQMTVSYKLPPRCLANGFTGTFVNPTCLFINGRSLEIPLTVPLTLSLLGYLKTRICWGGGQFDPAPLNPMFDVQIWQMIHHWKALVLYF